MQRWIIAALAIFWSLQASALDFSRYHDQGEIHRYLLESQKEFPNLVTVETSGKSQMGREISYAVIERQDGQKRPALFFNGAHHGNEWSSTEAALGIMDYILANLNSPFVTEILDKYAIVAQPIVNPDGHAHRTREGATGTDINRDYAFPMKDEQASFKSPETRIVRNITSQWDIRGAIAFHSGMEGVLWPSCFTDKPTLDHHLFYTLSKVTARAMGLNFFQQSYRDYPTEGEFIDYVYMKSRGLGLTVEVSKDGIPEEKILDNVVRRSVKGSLAYIRSLLAIDKGEFAIQEEPRDHRSIFGAPILANLVPAN